MSEYDEPVPETPDLGATLVQQCHDLHAQMHEAIDNREEQK